MEQKRHYRRRNYFIQKKFQGKFIIRFCSLVVLGAVIMGMIIFIYSQQTVTTSFYKSRLRIMSTADFILPALVYATVVVTILIGIATTAVVVLLSHRIAGPLYRLERTAREISRGDLSMRIQLRTNDELKAMATSMDEMVQGLKDKIIAVKDSFYVLNTALQDFSSLLANQQHQEGLKDIQEKKRKLDSAISVFKL